MKTTDLLTETSDHAVRKIWSQIENLLVDLSDETYELSDPELGKKIRQALEANDLQAVHRLVMGYLPR